MNCEQLNAVVDFRVAQITRVLSKKGDEYATSEDRLHNFNRAADVLRQTPEKCLVGFMAKHWVSVLDMVEGVSQGFLPKKEMIEEKIGDSINYLILLEAMLKERIEKENPGKDAEMSLKLRTV